MAVEWVQRFRRRKAGQYDASYWESKDRDSSDSDVNHGNSGSGSRRWRRQEQEQDPAAVSVGRVASGDFLPRPTPDYSHLPPADLNVGFVKRRSRSAVIPTPVEETLPTQARRRLQLARDRKRRQLSTKVMRGMGMGMKGGGGCSGLPCA
jgi:hypothetical protein